MATKQPALDFDCVQDISRLLPETLDKLPPRVLAKLKGEKSYFTGQPCPRGHVAWRSTESRSCRACDTLRSRAKWASGHRNNPDVRARANARWNASDRGREAKKKWEDGNRVWVWTLSTVRGARMRAAECNLPFDITNDYIFGIATTHCPVFGVEMTYRNPGGKASWQSPTLDRIVPKLGYVVGNVSVISKRANSIKHDASPDEIQAVADWAKKMWVAVSDGMAL